MAVQGGAGHEDVGPRPSGAADGVGADPAVDLDIDVVAPAGGIEHRGDLGDLGFHRVEISLTAEARIDGHHQHQIDQIQYMGHRRRRCRRIQRHGCGGSELGDCGQGSMQVPTCLGVDDQPIAAGVDVAGGHRIGFHHHQMGFEGQRGMGACRCDHVGSEGQIRHETTIHDIPLDEVDPGGFERGHLLAESGEVCGEHRGCDLDRAAHARRR